MRISLTVTAGPHEGTVFAFAGHDTFIVGRSKRSHFRLPHKDKYFSRVHFMVEVNPPYCRLMDMGSTNGTYVNGQRVKMVDLKHGDQIRAGKTELQVNVEGAESGPIQESPPFDAAPPRVVSSEPEASWTPPGFPALVAAAEPVPVAASLQPVAESALSAGYEPEPPPVPVAEVPAYSAPAFPVSPPELPAAPEPEVGPDIAVPAPRSQPSIPSFAPVPSPPAFKEGGPESLPGTLPPINVPSAAPQEPVPSGGSIARSSDSPSKPGQHGYLSGVPTPAAPPRPVMREPCLACGVPTVGSALAFGSAPDGGVPMICPACWDQIRGQHQLIAGYRIIKKLGHGGMGVVQLALREADNSLVALKTIIPAVAGSPTKVERFLREADILKDLAHPNIVAFREMSQSNGQLYFAMDYVPGTDASHLLKQNGGPLALGRGVRLICQLLAALDYAHSKGFVHRDIKPANLMVAQIKGEEVLKLADFGLARVYQASELSGLTMTGDMGGTLAFMAPEQITHFREAKPAADLYATAATLYNLITDRFVHDLPRPAEQRLMMILTEDVVPIQTRRADIPDALAAVIHRALLKETEMRYPDAKTMRQKLLPFAR